MSHSSAKLPPELLARAVYSDQGDYAWRVNDIPEIIEAARHASLVSLGGALQFYLPDGGICECYWVDVDAGEFPGGLDWQGKVEWSARACRTRFDEITGAVDLIGAGSDFGEPLKELAEAGTDLSQLMCFEWIVCDQSKFEELERPFAGFSKSGATPGET